VYIDSQEPWHLKKTDTERMKVVLWVVLEAVRRVAILLQPVMPGAMSKLMDQMAIPADQRSFESLDGNTLESREISKPAAVFPRVELAEAQHAS